MAHDLGPEGEPWRAVVASERIARLQAEVARDGVAAARRFWASLDGTPLWEPAGGEAGGWHATFLWRGDPELTRHVALCGPLLFSEDAGQPMEHVEGTDVWHLTLRLPPGTRAAYALSPNGWRGPAVELDELARFVHTWVRDPLNMRTFLVPRNEQTPEFTPIVLSLLEAPDAPPQPWMREPTQPRGRLERHELHSALLGNARRVWTYAPARAPEASDAAPLLIAFDGWRAVHVTKLPVVLDNLIAAGAIPPCRALLVDSGTLAMRVRELDCYEPFVAFLTDELLPWAGELWGIAPRRETTLVAGVSLGGRAAVFAGLRRPDAFGMAIGQASAVTDGGGPEHFRPLAVPPAELPIALYLDVGLLETDPSGAKSFLAGNRRLRRELEAAGHAVHYRELACGHDEVTLCESIAAGLRLLLARGAAYSALDGTVTL